ncbi:MAG: antitoxin Xre-like helix-turn-helix domain-containing protein [Steroidobacteraceae bacterium]
MAQAARPARAVVVLSRATLRAAEQLDLPERDLAQVLGVSAATVSRLAAGAWCLAEGSKTCELAAAFVRRYRSLAAITGGGPETMRARRGSSCGAPSRRGTSR